jgi:hypothetical protein
MLSCDVASVKYCFRVALFMSCISAVCALYSVRCTSRARACSTHASAMAVDNVLNSLIGHAKFSLKSTFQTRPHVFQKNSATPFNISQALFTKPLMVSRALLRPHWIYAGMLSKAIPTFEIIRSTLSQSCWKDDVQITQNFFRNITTPLNTSAT